MRHVLWPLAVLGLLAGFALFADARLERALSGLRADLAAVTRAVEAEDYPAADRAAETLAAHAERYAEFLASFFAHDETEAYSALLDALLHSLRRRRRDDCLRGAAALDERLRHMMQTDRITAGNLF